MQCPGCKNSQVVGAVPASDGTGNWVECPLCMQYGTPGQWPGAGKHNPYQLNFALTDQAAHLGSIVITTGLDFQWEMAIATRTGSFTFLMDVNGNQLQTVFTGQGQVSSAGVNDTNFWGTATSPFPLPVPIWLPEKTRLNISVTDTSLANNNISLFLIGGNFKSAGN